MGLLKKRGQLSVFVILAIVIVAGMVLVFVFRDDLFRESIDPNLKPVYDYYESCISEETKIALSLAGTQGGRISGDQYVPGSDYAPFSSHLNFLGFSVPYWFYIKGNGIIEQNVPKKEDIEKDVAEYVQNNLIRNCDFSDFYAKGFYIELADPEVKVKINDANVEVNVKSRLNVATSITSTTKENYDVFVQSQFGKMFSTALDIYEKQSKDAVLESYAVDVLGLYAPVDGVNIGCSPMVWKSQDVEKEIKEAMEANIQTVKFKGDYYQLGKKENEYFVVDQASDIPVRLLYDKNWPSRFEIIGEGNLLMAKPLGNQQGMGVIGFCYSPYHFVYDFSFPVMVQIYNEGEVFQFPVVVVIDNNKARIANLSELDFGETEDLCQYNTNDISINTYDINLNRVDADLSYNCFDQECSLGKSNGGLLNVKAPSCVNGYLIARAEGYAEKRQLFSSNKEFNAELILDKEYNILVDVRIPGMTAQNIFVLFEGETSSMSASIPGNNEVKLSEGNYNVSVYAYTNSSLTLAASKKTECVDMPQGGLSSLFGATKEECYNIEIPEQRIESALVGGGKSPIYFLPENLDGGRIIISAESLPLPKNIEELQNNFIQYDSLNLNFEYA